MKLSVESALDAARERGLEKIVSSRPRIIVGVGTCGVGNGGREVLQALGERLENLGLDASVVGVGCFGPCALEPLVGVRVPGAPMVILSQVTAADAVAIVDAVEQGVPPREKVLCKIERWDHVTGEVVYGEGLPEVPSWTELPFFQGQKKLVLRNAGLINPEDIEEYIGVGGYFALHKALTQMTPGAVIEELKKSRLRGRGGAGYPTANKWDILAKAPGPTKYLICNADEGDPGAYMNRNEMESDPHALLEGMLIGAWATGAERGLIYCRAEYPLAVLRLRSAIEDARDLGLLGARILGTSFNFDVEVVEGAGAFVCGEETALIASLEGRAGRPRPRPPYPGEKGLFGKPTAINNVETWYNVSPIVLRGGDWFATTGTKQSAGTKVFSLVGKVKNTGLVELPLGTPLKHLVYAVGGGTGTSRSVKAVQSGGPSGGCIPTQHFDAPVDYESLAALGAIMGSGGMVVMDDDTCMVDVARYFLEFTRNESCGKCVPCRVGLDQAHRLLDKVCHGRAEPRDLAQLEQLSRLVRDTALCGLGQSAPNPVLTTFDYFRAEYERHVVDRRCDAGACEDLFVAPCENTCPAHMNIPGFLQLLKEGRHAEAVETVVLDNPLAASTGRVCQHPCEGRCRRAQADAAVSIRNVHRHLADLLDVPEVWAEVSRRVLARKQPSTGKTVGVVGAGPAGLAAAFYLSLLGHAVTVYDAEPEPGGLLRWAIPEYRLPREVLAREVKLITAAGARFLQGVRVGEHVALDELESAHDALFVAFGTGLETDSGVPGGELPGVTSSLAFLHDAALNKHQPLGQKVVVIGGGNSAIDAARTHQRLGGEVHVVYRRGREDMPAIAEEVEAAIAEGIRFTFYAKPTRIVGPDRVTGLEVERSVVEGFELNGRRAIHGTGEVTVLPCDAVVLAIGEQVDPQTVAKLGLEAGSRGRVKADARSQQSSRPKVLAGGDAVSGPGTVAAAMGSGKRAAAELDRRLMGRDRMALLRAQARYAQVVPPAGEGGPRNAPPELPLDKRMGSFAEVVLGLGAKAAVSEAHRCLRCDVRTAGEMA